jgi:hypothetical protein
MITKNFEIIKTNELELVKRYGEQIIDKPIYHNIANGIEDYYIIVSNNMIVDDFILYIRDNNKINLHISLNNFYEYIDMIINNLSTKYKYLTFTICESVYGKEKLNYLRNKYKIISDSIKLFDMTELVIRI